MTSLNNLVIFGTDSVYQEKYERLQSKTAKDSNGSRPADGRFTEEAPIRAAENDTTLQDWVAIAIKKELDRQDQEKGKGAV